jgi:uncharacterized protein
MGMDWHSSGITTSVLGALKRGLAPLDRELGLYVCGGRGKHSRRTPDELVAIGERVGFDGDSLATASRLVAKVDSAAVQDGFDLYLHGFVVAEDGGWVVVQQGMNGASRQARRYHWLSEGLKSFVEEPHAAIEGRAQGDIINLTDRRAEASRRGQLELLAALGPDGIARELAAIGAEDVKVQVQGTSERGAADFPDLLLTPGVGARTVRALALVAEVVNGAPCRFSDPARFSLAHGGKDRHPFPVPLKVYDETIRVLKSAVQRAKLGQDEQLAALQRLDEESRKLERAAKGPTFEGLLAEERAHSHQYGGRSVFGWEPPVEPAADCRPA